MTQTIVRGQDTFVFNFNPEEVYIGQRNVVTITCGNNSSYVRFYTSLHGTSASPIAEYKTDSSHKVTIDLTDYFRTYGDAIDSISFKDEFDAAQSFDIGSMHLYPINIAAAPKSRSGQPLDMPSMMFEKVGSTKVKFAFINNGVVGILDNGVLQSVYMPTSHEVNGDTIDVIKNQNNVYGMHIVDDIGNAFDVRYKEQRSSLEHQFVWVSGTQEFYSSSRNPNVGSFVFPDDQDEQYHPAEVMTRQMGYSAARTVVKPLVCGVKYASVRWISLTGLEKCHTFEVAKYSISANDTKKFATIDGSHHVESGYADSITLRLADLNAYDYWYYSDIVCSSSVEVSLDGTNFTKVEVTTNTATMPDGDGDKFSTLEVSVNLNEYDSVTL